MSLAPSEQLAVAVWQILADRLGLADAPPGHRLVENGRPTLAAIDLADAPHLSGGELALASFAIAEWTGKLGSLAAIVRSCDSGVRGRVLDAVMASHAMDRIVDGVLADTTTTVDWATERITAIRALLTAWDTDEEAEHEQLVRAIRCCVSGDPVPPEITAAAHAGIAAARAEVSSISAAHSELTALASQLIEAVGENYTTVGVATWLRHHIKDQLRMAGSGVVLEPYDVPGMEAARAAHPTAPHRTPGTRMFNGGVMGTVETCDACSGDGVLHRPDVMPEPSTPMDPPATAAVESQVVVDPDDTWAGVLDEAEFLSEESYPDTGVMELDQPKPKVVDLMDQLEKSLAIAKAARAAREAGA